MSSCRWWADPSLPGSQAEESPAGGDAYGNSLHIYSLTISSCRWWADSSLPGSQAEEPPAGGDAGGAGGQPPKRLLQQDHPPAHHGEHAGAEAGGDGEVPPAPRQTDQHFSPRALSTDCGQSSPWKGKFLREH